MDKVYIEDFNSTKVISLFNIKGGSGKTSVAGSLAYEYSVQNNKVLLIDTNSNTNLTHSFGLDLNETKNLYIALTKEESLVDHIVNTKYPLIDIIVSDDQMFCIEMLFFPKLNRENILKSILEPVIQLGTYDFIIIDTPSNLGALNMNVLNVTDICIIPVTTDSFGVENIDTVLDFIKGVQKFNQKLKCVKILFNKYDLREKIITSHCERYVRKNFSDLLLNTVISIDTNIEKAQFDNVPVQEFKTTSRIAKEYKKLSTEIIKLSKNTRTTIVRVKNSRKVIYSIKY